ncbi:MAG TPA: homoserine dehydrogenase [Vitreimonas sp.]|nr:homoserine dehydrogenase [Vitreimonas sp.]
MDAVPPEPTVTAAPLRVAVLGAGTVGLEVVRSLLDAPDRLAAAADGRPFELAGVAVRDVDRAVARGLPEELITDAPAHLVASPDTDVIVELMGGDEPARTLIAAALSAGKSVVTANKHVIAHHGAAFEAAARGSRAALRFEAAVAGGIPILGPLAGDLAANRVTRVRGIVNGTTNYILTAMAEGSGTYEAVLREAQELGYAEADPSGDVEGRDAINKLVILARLAFDAWLDPDLVADRPARLHGPGGPGITGVTADELAGAAAVGLTIRLLAVTERAPGGAPTASVVPTAVPLDSPLGRTSGVRNRVEIRAEPLGEVGLDGPGAGGPATSSAVLGDLVAVARGLGSTWGGRPSAGEIRTSGAEADADRPRRWFALLPGARAGKVLASVAEALEQVAAGVAVRTSPLAPSELAERIVAAAPETLDATLYPIDD